MKEESLQFWIDASCPSAGRGRGKTDNVDVVLLVPDEGEYACAVRKLARLGERGPAGRRVPDEVYLHLFAYELLERMREFMQDRTQGVLASLVLPFWPECLFEAAGLLVHGAREIQALFPETSDICYVSRSRESVEEEAVRVLGDVRFDPEAYLGALSALAAQKGWRNVQADACEYG